MPQITQKAQTKRAEFDLFIDNLNAVRSSQLNWDSSKYVTHISIIGGILGRRPYPPDA